MTDTSPEEAEEARQRQTLLAVYPEICKTHGAIADFRAKLLALLPIASGAGIFLLLGKFNGGDRKLLVPVGLFGVAVTFGLFMYELRGIEDCTVLRGRAWNIERRLGIPDSMSQFGGWLAGGKRNLADEIGAAWIVYTTVLASWLFVAGAGLARLTGTWPSWLAIELAIALGIVYLAVLVLALSRLGPWGHDFWGRRTRTGRKRRTRRKRSS
jgi:hypothetical protein